MTGTVCLSRSRGLKRGKMLSDPAGLAEQQSMPWLGERQGSRPKASWNRNDQSKTGALGPGPEVTVLTSLVSVPGN